MIRLKLLEMMEKAGVKSQLELHRITGLSQTTITKMRRHHSFRHDSLDKLCRVLDCSPGDLLEFHK